MALRGRARTVCYVERDAFAAAVLLARMADSFLERAPVWDDLITFDARAWRGVVDLVTAGFPCQPWSVAGKRKGLDDERWLWPDIIRIVRDCEPSFVFLENVPGLYRHGLREVLSDLAALGFDAEWTCVSATDIGASHRRERVFILAHRDATVWDESGRRNGTYRPGAPEPRHAGKSVEHTERPRCTGGRSTEYAGGEPVSGCWAFPPGPSDAEGWRQWIVAGGPKPGLCRGSDGLPSRMDQLRALGNAVIPAQAAAAFQILMQRGGDT
jgi:DNA (cytosine-5)-methyltransferase 1